MPLERIRIDRLRILEDVDCRLHPERNYFFGPNGAGKTSLLEAIHLLGRGRSFRTRQTKRLVQHGRETLAVFAELQVGGEAHRVGVSFGSAGLEYRIDRRPGASVTELARLLRVDVIDPGIHKLIEGGPSERRRFLDWGVFHVEHNYLDQWKRFRRVLGQRNAALKARAEASALAAWSHALAEPAVAVDDARRRYTVQLAAAAKEIGGRLLGQPLTVEYRRGWRSGVSFIEALEESAERDRAFGHTQIGPHRADLFVTAGDGALSEEASRGQQKLAAAALVIAQVRVAASTGDRNGTLLVDDPAAELDRAALGRLMMELEGLPSQLILTALSRELLPPDERFPVFHVEQGRVERCYNASI